MADRPATSWQSGWRSAAGGDASPALDHPQSRGWAAFLPQWFIRWAPPATLGAASLSLLVHFIIGIIAALIYVGGAQAGGGAEGKQAGGVGVAVMTETELGQMQNAGLDAETPAVPEIAQAALP